MARHAASCQCGSLSVAASADPDFTLVCSCTLCQKRSGSPFGAAAYFRKDALTLSGPSKTWARPAASGRVITNHFCPDCGATVYYALELRPDHLGVCLGAFDTPAPTPEWSVWNEHRAAWVHFPEDWPAHPKGSPGT